MNSTKINSFEELETTNLSRRAFLIRSGKVAVGLITCSAFARCAYANAMGLPVGIQLYSISEPLTADTPGTLRKLHEMGFRQVETASFGKYSAKEFRVLLKDAGLVAPSAHLRLDDAEIGSQLDDANAIGVQYATSSNLRPNAPAGSGAKSGDPIAVLPPTRMEEEDFKKLARQMNAIGARVKAAGLRYAYHNHNYEFARVGSDRRFGYDILLKETDPDLVFFEIDCGWMIVAGGDPVQYLRDYPGRIRMLHIKDFQPVRVPDLTLYGPNRPLSADLGHGFINYTPIFTAGKAAGVQHAFAEQERPFPISQLASAKVDYDYLHHAF